MRKTLFDAIPEDGGKYLRSVSGEYGMLQTGGAQSAWYEQTDRATAAILKAQNPAALIRSNGEVDAITGVSITILPHFELAQRALQNARRNLRPGPRRCALNTGRADARARRAWP